MESRNVCQNIITVTSFCRKTRNLPNNWSFFLFLSSLLHIPSISIWISFRVSPEYQNLWGLRSEFPISGHFRFFELHVDVRVREVKKSSLSEDGFFFFYFLNYRDSIFIHRQFDLNFYCQRDGSAWKCICAIRTNEYNGWYPERENIKWWKWFFDVGLIFMVLQEFWPARIHYRFF